MATTCVLQTLCLAARTPEELINRKEKDKKRIKICFDICFMLSLWKMKSKAFIIAVVFVCLLLAGGGIYLFTSRNKTEETVSPASQEQKLPQPSAAPKLLTWNDPAGFTFQYDPELKIDNHPQDKVNYANLEITEAGKEGKVLIMAADTKYKSVSEWAAKAIDATLGGKPAKRIVTAGSDKVVVGTIDDKILFTIEMDPAGVTTWQKRFDQIISSYEFVYPTSAPGKSSPSTSGSSEGDIVEEEEIIE